MVNSFDADIHHRRSIRLKDYNYSSPGAYFVTICTKNKECFFGEIREGILDLNDAGRMVEKWWLKLTGKFPSIQMDSFIVMPNHLHGIIQIVGAIPCDRPDDMKSNQGTHMGAPLHGQIDDDLNVGADPCVCPDDRTNKGTHAGAPLQGIIQWFKTMTTNEYIAGVKQSKWPAFDGKLWQRNYYDHIIRNEKSLEEKREYIVGNPLKWDIDYENPLNKK